MGTEPGSQCGAGEGHWELQPWDLGHISGTLHEPCGLLLVVCPFSFGMHPKAGEAELQLLSMELSRAVTAPFVFGLKGNEN